MLQQSVKIEVENIINNHQSRKNPIKYKDILRAPTLSEATKTQVSEAIKQLRNDGKPISSRPNVGYYLSKTEMKGCLKWCQNWRKSMGVNTLTPKCLEWV